jgi:hypothetical protein
MPLETPSHSGTEPNGEDWLLSSDFLSLFVFLSFLFPSFFSSDQCVRSLYSSRMDSLHCNFSDHFNPTRSMIASPRRTIHPDFFFSTLHYSIICTERGQSHGIWTYITKFKGDNVQPSFLHATPRHYHSDHTSIRPTYLSLFSISAFPHSRQRCHHAYTVFVPPPQLCIANKATFHPQNHSKKLCRSVLLT